MKKKKQVHNIDFTHGTLHQLGILTSKSPYVNLVIWLILWVFSCMWETLLQETEICFGSITESKLRMICWYVILQEEFLVILQELSYFE